MGYPGVSPGAWICLRTRAAENESLARSDGFEVTLLDMIDGYIS